MNILSEIDLNGTRRTGRRSLKGRNTRPAMCGGCCIKEETHSFIFVIIV